MTFEELEALDSSRALYMPTQALEVAWDGSGSVRWVFDEPLETTDHGVLAFRVLQVHDDPLNDDGVVVRVWVNGLEVVTVEPGSTPDWLETTVPKSSFETARIPIHGMHLLYTIKLEFPGSVRILVDDLELSPGCE
ncbi:MAG: hypothetical protein GY913_23925 [Proteobacteria bacterium]|nr:hypothetical protein [Pseudomonadota bacterium]MCP4919963.1 hypothetical protein [Pseudomonadota bacterium]